MTWTLVRYRTKAEKADENACLVAAVFEELQRKAPPGLRYATLRAADDTFVHLVSRVEGAMKPSELDAFRAFASGVDARCIEPPMVLEASVVGNYRMLPG